MKLLHIADLHIGKRVCEFSMLEEQRHVLSQVVRLLRERSVDALLVAGDLYDKSAPSAEAVALVDWFLSAVAETGVPVVIIAGNHDSAERVAYAGGLLSREGIHVSPVYDGHIEPVELADEHGPVRIWPIPFLHPATVRHFFPDAEIRSYTDALRTVVDALDLKANATCRNVCVAHQFVTAGTVTPERSDSELSLGGMDNVDASVFDGFDYVALGHVHRPQRIGADTVRYAGSILKYSFSEERGQKSAVLVELGAPGSKPDIELVPLRPIHDLRRVTGTVDELLAAEAQEGGGKHAGGTASSQPGRAADDYLHVVLTDENPVLDVMRRLRAVYPNVMGIEYDNARTRAGLGSDPAMSAAVDDSTPMELFGEFYERQNGIPLTEAQRQVVADALEKIGRM